MARNRKRKNHQTTKNTVAKPPITRFRVIRVELSNGSFDLVTDFKTQEEFDRVFMQWYDDPKTRQWDAYTLIGYIKERQPSRICLLEEDYNKHVEPHRIPATKEDWEAENN